MTAQPNHREGYVSVSSWRVLRSPWPHSAATAMGLGERVEVIFDQSTRREAWWGGVIVNEFSDKKGAQWVGVLFDDGDSHTYDYDHCISNGTLRKEEKQEVSRAPRPTHAAHMTHLLVPSTAPTRIEPRDA